jgi:hypothetical protein
MRSFLLAALALAAHPALAHTTERGFVMLLPTGLYILGGALAVALSFVVMWAVPSPAFAAAMRFRRRLAGIASDPGLWPSAAALALLVLLVHAGFTGTRDPLANPLPPFVWSLWWVGFSFLVALLGDLWAALNPWRALHRLAVVLARLREPPLAYPGRLGAWPAVAAYFAFAWFELVHPAPFDPGILAAACAGYAALTLAGMLVFGADAWLAGGEAFSVFFRMVGWLSALRPEGRRIALAVPCAGLLDAGTLSRSRAAFVLLALASVSFDGLSRTFWWLDLIGENPLEHPGRSVLVGVNTLGLAGTWLALMGAYAAVVRAGVALAGRGAADGSEYGRYVVAIVPIAFAYHFSHYLTSFLVDAQHALRALADPLEFGWNLTGFRDWHVTASMLTDHDSVHAIWNLQVAVIVLGHVAAVCVAHALALRAHRDARAALASQAPMTALMVGYTVFGLWLLSTPTAG